MITKRFLQEMSVFAQYGFLVGLLSECEKAVLPLLAGAALIGIWLGGRLLRQRNV